MNIKEAKQYIKDTVKLYLKKDEAGDYRIPTVRQRPVFLLGAPGIGKTAIMEQIAAELNIAIVSYSMTHHTRQSALGLPFITKKNYGEEQFDVSEYTMSEIISSVYEVMEGSGIKEGILFLDEINCVSETLAPSMLQFLQYKVFGKHRVPDGWVIVTAGNPPEYNKSVREFDVVTLDRLKIIDVEAEYGVWKEYARNANLHPAIINYLDINKEDFYGISTTVDGKNYVTARGWEDLSEIIKLYEEDNIKVTETLIFQYIRNKKTVNEFYAYYDLYLKYKNDYNIDDILSGIISEKVKFKAEGASFDERLSLMGMLIQAVSLEIKEVNLKAEGLREIAGMLKAIKAAGDNEKVNLCKLQLEAKEKNYDSLLKAGTLKGGAKKKQRDVIEFMKGCLEILNSGEGFEKVSFVYNEKVSGFKKSVSDVKEKLHNLFVFTKTVFKEGNELLILMTELTVNDENSGFIANYGCEDYSENNKEMMLSDKTGDIMRRVEELV